MPQTGLLVLTRHVSRIPVNTSAATNTITEPACIQQGQSEWNKLNLFTGWKDPALTDLGREVRLMQWADTS